MTSNPRFPEFKPIELEDRDFIKDVFHRYQPESSECTFTNLFIWRCHYAFQWSRYEDWLLLVCEVEGQGGFALQPIGPPSRLAATRMLFQWLRDEKGQETPRIERADRRFVAEIEEEDGFVVEPTEDHFDYVYRSEDLIQLAGRKYHAKRNHINKFLRSYSFDYRVLDADWIKPCLELADRWCRLHRCQEDLNLLGEWEAVHEALNHFSELQLQGGVILVRDRVEAFAVGEALNDETAVVHLEKANPEIPGLYALINQQFCEHAFEGLRYVNREQDLGQEGLRKAKQSYYPEHMVEKYRVAQESGRP